MYAALEPDQASGRERACQSDGDIDGVVSHALMLRRNVTVARNLLPFSEQGAKSIFGAGGDVNRLVSSAGQERAALHQQLRMAATDSLRWSTLGGVLMLGVPRRLASVRR
jgi:hypothetical protein